MSDPSETFSPPMLPAIGSSTPSADSEPGHEPCETPDGPTKFQSGLAAAPVRRSHKQGRSEDSTMTDTSGPIGSDSSKPVDLLASLVSRYRARTDSRGSTLFTIAWKVRATPSGRLIPAQRGSARRTSASASTSWPSPVREDAKSSARHGYMITGNPGTTLLDAARLTSPQSSWTTPVASDEEGNATAGLEVCGVPSERGGLDDGAASELGDSRSNGNRQHGRELPGDEAQHEERPEDGDHASVVASPADRAVAASPADRAVAASPAYRPGDRVRIVDDPTWGGAVGGFWARDVEWIYCRPAPGHEDGCFRPASSLTVVLADEHSSDVVGSRTAQLKALGNAIVLEQARTFVEAVIETLADAAETLDGALPVEVPDSVPPPEVPIQTEWTGPHPDELAPSGMLLGHVPSDRWPHGPPSAHEDRCNLFPRRGSLGGLFCDCRLADAAAVTEGAA